MSQEVNHAQPQQHAGHTAQNYAGPERRKVDRRTGEPTGSSASGGTSSELRSGDRRAS